MENTIGLTAKKDEDLSEWYSQVVLKAELADYSSVSGCMVLRPTAYAVWEKIKETFDAKIRATGHKNVYFPLFIPENLLQKEENHIKGFSPEVAWVTHAGDTKLAERLAIRPTSETIMYESYAKWIRSWRDLPLLLNQWCNVVRWEFKYPKPFLRTREFLWQEGHTAHATRVEAQAEADSILKEYVDLIEGLLAIPVISGMKTESEKFAGAEYTLAVEALMPDGKAVQMGTSHLLAQNFSKAFEISFLDKDNAKQYVWQTSWGISTRLIGAMIMVHGDDQGLVLPPKVAPLQVTIVPILFEKDREKVLHEADKLCRKLEKHFTTFLDDRDYSAGWKFHDHELKGVPIRIEIGPKDIEKGHVVVVRRDTKKKTFVKDAELVAHIEKELEDMQKDMLDRARKSFEERIIEVHDLQHFEKAIADRMMVKAAVHPDDEQLIVEKTGATPRCIAGKAHGKSAVSDKDAQYIAYFAKAY